MATARPAGICTGETAEWRTAAEDGEDRARGRPGSSISGTHGRSELMAVGVSRGGSRAGAAASGASTQAACGAGHRVRGGRQLERTMSAVRWRGARRATEEERRSRGSLRDAGIGAVGRGEEMEMTVTQ